MAGIEVRGGRELRASLKQAGMDMADMKSVHAQVAQVVAHAATPPKRTGALAASIRPAGQAAKAYVRAGGARVRYAAVQEYGSPKRNIPAHHYLSKAVDRTQAKWAAMYLDGVQEICDKVRGI